MLNLNDEKSTPKVVETGQCWFCKQTRPLTETMYMPFSFLTDKITRRYATGEILRHWQEAETRVPRDFLMEKNSVAYLGGRNTRNAKELETKWKYKIVNVPRCAECLEVHESYQKTYKLVRLLILLAGAALIGLFVWNAYKMSGGEAAVIIALISLFIFYFIVKLISLRLFTLIKYLANRWGYNTERRSETFPEVAESLKQGWTIGENPDVIPESYSV